MTGSVVQGHIWAGNAERQATDLTSVEVSDDFDDDLVVFIRGLLSGNHYFSSGEVLQFVYLGWVVQAQSRDQHISSICLLIKLSYVQFYLIWWGWVWPQHI